MLTHLDSEHKPTMVDVSAKSVTARVATARCLITLPLEVLAAVEGDEILSKKGPVMATARIAGTMAVKRTAELIPLCHPLPIESIKFKTSLVEQGCEITCTVKASHKTGVEMEALTGVQVAALTIYDMCKAVSQAMVIKDCQLVRKTGGKNDYDARL